MKTQKIVKFVNKLNVKFVVVKVNGNWVKTCQEVQKPINSWNGIISMIDDIFDNAAEDHVILHKPFPLEVM